MAEQHPDLARLLAAHAALAPGRRRLWLAGLALAWVLVLVTEGVARLLVANSLVSLPQAHVSEPGDLLRMAGLPRYDGLDFPGDKPGERPADPPHGLLLPRSQRAEVIVCGASFFAIGGAPEQQFAGQLARFSGRRVYNAARFGAGPVASLLELLDSGVLADGRPRTVVWGVVQRSWSTREMRDLIERLGPAGELLPARPSSLGEVWQDLTLASAWLDARWTGSSPLRGWLAPLAPFVPPTALDPGTRAPARLYAFRGQPMLVYTSAISSAERDLEARGGDALVEACERLERHLARLGQRLIVVTVPDKFEIYRDRLQPRPSSRRGFVEPGSFGAELTRRLGEGGIQALDLYPALHAASLLEQGGPPYWRHDTHWAPAGIEVAARTLAQTLP